MKIKPLEKFILRRIAKRLVIQGYDHETNIIEYYKIVNDAARREFTEDTGVGLACFLIECHRKSLFDIF